MPQLAAWLGRLLLGLIAQLAPFLARRTAVGVAAAILVAGAWATTFASLKALWATLPLAVPQGLIDPIMLVKPSHFDATLAAYISGRVIIAGYKWAKETTRAISFVASAPTGGGKGVVGSVSSGPTGASNPGNLYGGL